MSNIETTLKNATQTLAILSDSPALDAEILLCLVLKKDRSYLRAWSEKNLTSQQNLAFEALLLRRVSGVPIAYITGTREFWSRDFKVSSAVLIPRPDTELLIELSLDLMRDNSAGKIIDLGTGSGIIGITLAAELPQAEIIATDMSLVALEIAKENAQFHQVNNIHFSQNNWLENITITDFDLIISNPPYIAQDDIHLTQGDVRFEPQTALVSENNGLKDIESILKSAQSHLNRAGHVLIEHGYNQQQSVQALFDDYGYVNIKTHTDLANNPRVTSGQWLD